MFGSHKRASDAVPVIEGCPARTHPEPAHTDSGITSTETPIDDHSNYGDLELAKYN